MTELRPVDEATFWELVRNRRSVRRYADLPVPPEVVWKLLEAAHWAPSAHNRQPWRFVVVAPGAARRRLADGMADRWQADLVADGVTAAMAAERAAHSRQRIVGAPVVILPCLDLTTLDPYPDAARQRAEWQMGVQSVALACQNLLLAAHAYGLAACWLCAPIFCVELVQQVLDLPVTFQPQALLTAGYPPADSPREKSREPLADRVIFR